MYSDAGSELQRICSYKPADLKSEVAEVANIHAKTVTTGYHKLC